MNDFMYPVLRTLAEKLGISLTPQGHVISNRRQVRATSAEP